MTLRERHTSDEAPAQDVTWTRSASASSSTLPSGPVPLPPNDGSLWADWYQRASPVQQQEALLLFLQQGVIYAHQLAAPARASAPSRSLLFGLLNGQVKGLEPLHPPALEYHDSQLDQRQREGVARAVATPDVCLIQGLPGTGKSRLIAEILLQAAQRGERILFAAATTAALDRVLERLGRHPAVCPIRFLAAEEKLTQLPQAVARLTVSERLRDYRETTLPAARAARDAARKKLESYRSQQEKWARLEKLTEQYTQLAEQMWNLTARRAAVVEEVERLDAKVVFGARWPEYSHARTETIDRLDGQLAGLQAELETTTGKQARLEGEWESIRPLAEARRGRRFWTASWWRSLPRSGLNEQVRDLEGRRAELRGAQQRLEKDLEALQRERAQIETRYSKECQRLREEERTRRYGKLDGEIAAVSGKQNALRQEWLALLSALNGDAPANEISPQTLAAERDAWEQLRHQDALRAEAAEQWLQTIEDGAKTLPHKLAACANVIAAPTATLASEALSGDLPIFDVLILEESHQVTESEFAAAARRARRWVLIGEAHTDGDTIAVSSRKHVHPVVPRPSFFQRLWQSLHADPHDLPFAWMQQNGRLVCRLRSFAADQEKWLEIEPVVDRPDIELRILSRPRQVPQVVEVLFPTGMGIGAAKQFIFHELEELAVQTPGRSLCWTETAEDVQLEFAPRDEGETEMVALENGVCERVARFPASDSSPARDGTDWHTCALVFARAAGWTRERAEEWIAERLALRSLGRTVLLTASHRLAPPLADFLSDLLFAGLYQPVKGAAEAALCRPPVEFVPVPAIAPGESSPRGGGGGRNNRNPAAAVHGERVHGSVSVRTPRLRSAKGGAGLEVDLADDRPLTQLPSDLRPLLPRQGLVNYLEALAVVKHLQTLLNDENVRVHCEQWRQRRFWPCQHGCGSPAVCDCPLPNNTPVVAVIALYAAQVELLRHLIEQTPALSRGNVAIEVGPPSVFCHRECLFALVSLTRSHTHRAVSYGEHPHALIQALTRAASGLILFGDPGTLARRSQWRGPLDHLDERAAQSEGQLIGQLVHYLQGKGRHAAVFHVQEGCGQ